MKTLSCLFFGLLVFVITLCSIFTACVFKGNENFYQVFWGSVIVVIAFLIAFSICFCKEKSKEDTNKFETVRSFVCIAFQIITFVIFVIVLLYSFFNERHNISKEMLLLSIFLLVISVGLAYDKISVTKILQFEKEIKNKKEEADEYKSRYDTIAKEFSAVLRLSQKQIVANYNNNGNSTSINWDACNKEEKEDSEITSESQESEVKSKSQEQVSKNKVNYPEIEKKIWETYISNLVEFNEDSVKRDISISLTDDVSRSYAIFDYYYKLNDVEYFVELKLINRVKNYFHIRGDIEKKLNIINQRKKQNGINIKLNLVLGYTNDTKDSEIINIITRINKDFSPAITSGILGIEPIKFEM